MKYGWLFVALAALAGGTAGCAPQRRSPRVPGSTARGPMVAGVWDGVLQAKIDEGMAAGDTRIERQEWHLAQSGATVSGYYVVALTMVSGDGRPYMCNRQPRFSSMVRFDVKGRVTSGVVDLEEITQLAAEGTCNPGPRRLSKYRGELRGDVLTLIAATATGGQRQTLYRRPLDEADSAPPAIEEIPSPVALDSPFPSLLDGPSAQRSAATADVGGTWVWEYRGIAPGGDEKHEREEWHVRQEGARLTGYYDRIVRQVSTDGHAYRCSMAMEFRISTRYRITGEVRGEDIVIYENTFEVLEPSPCDNGKRRLDAYQGRATGEEIRLMWGVGGQILRRARPDVPTQRF